MAKKVPKKVRTIVNEAREELREIYHDRLKQMILYGSYARGDHAEGSDIDIVMLLERLTDVTVERKKYLPIVSRISLKYDTVLSIVPLDFDEFHRKRTPLILNVSREGIQL